MALVPDMREMSAMIMNLRRQVAQNTTDIQRLWRLTSRVVHEPFFTIGGDNEDHFDSSGGQSYSGGEGSGPDSGGPGYPTDPPDSSDSGGGGTGGGGGGDPGGGPNDSSAAGDDDCVWMWNGSSWVKVVDNTSGCECPEPDTSGTTIGQLRITNCEDCFIDCHGCDIPCQITCTITAVGTPGEPLSDVAGSHTLNHNGSEWVSSCLTVDVGGGLYTSAKIRVGCAGASLLSLSVEFFLAGDCTGSPTAQAGTQTSFTCDPLSVVFSMGGGNYEGEITA